MMADVSSGQTVAKHLAHKRDERNVFVASLESARGQLRAGLRIPTEHPYFNDWLEPHFDLLIWLEAVRQAVEALLHTFENVPLEQQFVIRQLSVGLVGSRAPRHPTQDAGALFTPQRVRRGSDGLLRFVTGEAVFSSAGQPIGSFHGSLRLLDRSVYEEARSGSRSTVTSKWPVAPLAPVEVGRRDKANVVIGNVTSRGTATAAALSIAAGHCFFSDHPSDHHSGLALIEAARQLATFSLTRRTSPERHRPALVALTADFMRFADVGEQIDLLATPRSPGGVDVAIATASDPLGTLTLEFDDVAL